MTTASAKRDESARVIDGIEQKLYGSFRPLHPDTDFVKRVRRRLIANPSLRMEQPDTVGAALGLLGLVALVLSILFGRWIWRYLFDSNDSGE